MAVGDAQLNATADVAGTFVYSVAAGSVLPAGDYSMTATFVPANHADFVSAATLSANLHVAKAEPHLEWQPRALVVGTPLGPEQLSAVAAVPGSYEYTPTAGVLLPAGQHVLAVVFTPADVANFVPVTRTVAVSVTYAVCPVGPVASGARTGSTVPIRVRVCDAAGGNLSRAALALTAVRVQGDGVTAATDSGYANQDGAFRYDANLEGYVFNLQTKGLTVGRWELVFGVAGDPLSHVVPFTVK
jgi:hypothetical protein